MVRIEREIFFIAALLLLLAPQAEARLQLGENGPALSGFFECAWGIKLEDDTTKRDAYNMLEQRLQLQTHIYLESFKLLRKWMAEGHIKGDFTIDEYYSGKTDFDLRELNIILSPRAWMDVKLGRQVFTWGTGDYLFVNDLFPKDYVSFYIGRDDEYLKKPSDGAKLSCYTESANMDVVIIPFFEPSTFFKGDRLSFFDPFLGGIAARDSDWHVVEPPRQFNNTAYATRLYRTFSSYEVALYAFRGFYSLPRGYLDEIHRELFYPRLDVYGGSVRGPALGGIGNVEWAFYNSRQDSNGDNRLIPNAMMKYLLGYEKDLGNDLKVGIQYLCEQMRHYTHYRGALHVGDIPEDEYRHLTTLRITKLYKNQTVKTNVFAFFSPSDMDTYIRLNLDYDVNDHCRFSVGANLIWGRDDYTEFGQMERNKNIYVRLRYSF